MGLKNNLFRLKVFLKDSDKKPIILILKEFFKLWYLKGRFPIHYIGRFLYRKQFKNPEDFMDMHEYRSFIYAKKNNQEEYVNLLANKFLFSLVCEKYKIPTPYVIGHNNANLFFLDNNIIQINTIDEMVVFFQNLFEKYEITTLFIKSFCGYGGRQVLVLELNNLNDQLASFGKLLFQDSYIFQEGIVQHEELNSIYSISINTLRVETYIDNQSKTHVLGTTLRFGSAGNKIDNISSGGIFVPVNSKTGRLVGNGMQSMIYGGAVHYSHPDTDKTFHDFQIPFFKESLELSKELTKYIPNKLAGWDIAITPIGPVVIEGNHLPMITLGEIGYQGYVKHPLYKEMMSNL